MLLSWERRSSIVKGGGAGGFVVVEDMVSVDACCDDGDAPFATVGARAVGVMVETEGESGGEGSES